MLLALIKTFHLSGRHQSEILSFPAPAWGALAASLRREAELLGWQSNREGALSSGGQSRRKIHPRLPPSSLLPALPTPFLSTLLVG